MKPDHNEAIRVIKAQMSIAMNAVKAECRVQEDCSVEKSFKSALSQLEYRNTHIMERFGFTYLGAGARRIGFSYTYNGVRYIVKGDKEHNDFILDEGTGNLADWIANETLTKLYPVLKPMVAVIYGGFDIDECLFLVQEPITTADECDEERQKSLYSDVNTQRKRVLVAVSNDIAGNGQNYGVDSEGNLKVSDLDRFQMRKATSDDAKRCVEAYERWVQSQLQNQNG